MLDMPLAQAAREANVSPVTLRKAAARGQLEAQKQAGRWFTTKQSLVQYLEIRPRRGRPSHKMDRKRCIFLQVAGERKAVDPRATSERGSTNNAWRDDPTGTETRLTG